MWLTVLTATPLRFVCVSSRRRGGGGGGINLGGLTLALPALLVVPLALLIVVVIDEGTRLPIVAGAATAVAMDALLGIAVVILIDIDALVDPVAVAVVVVAVAVIAVVIVIVVVIDVVDGIGVGIGVVVDDERGSSRYSQDEATGGGCGCAATGAIAPDPKAAVYTEGWGGARRVGLDCAVMAVVGNNIVVVIGLASGRGPNDVVARFGSRRSSLECASSGSSGSCSCSSSSSSSSCSSSFCSGLRQRCRSGTASSLELPAKSSR